jgi:hypothetical protein
MILIKFIFSIVFNLSIVRNETTKGNLKYASVSMFRLIEVHSFRFRIISNIKESGCLSGIVCKLFFMKFIYRYIDANKDVISNNPKQVDVFNVLSINEKLVYFYSITITHTICSVLTVPYL